MARQRVIVEWRIEPLLLTPNPMFSIFSSSWDVWNRIFEHIKYLFLRGAWDWSRFLLMRGSMWSAKASRVWPIKGSYESCSENYSGVTGSTSDSLEKEWDAETPQTEDAPSGDAQNSGCLLEPFSLSVCGLVTLASPGNFLEMQNLRFRLRRNRIS